ncbi:MAG: acyl-CoA dehydrogenase family protein, partial [Pyrinomonadaceae bacterium]
LSGKIKGVMSISFPKAVKIIEKRELAIANILNIANEIADFAQTEASTVDYESGFPVETFQRIRDAGLLAAPLDRNHGGLGLTGANVTTTLPLLQVFKSLGRGNLAVGRVYEGHVNALLLVALYGAPEQIKFFADSAKAGKIFGVWNTEAGDGVKIFPTDNNNFRLEGAKTFASGTDFVTRPFVNCAFADGGWQMCIVPMEKVATKTDESWWQPLGMRATRSFKVDFTDVELSAENLIGAPGDYYCQPWFSGGAIRFAAVQLGGAESLFDETRKYLQKLNRTGDPFQRARLGEMAIRLESGNLWLNGASAAFDNYLRSEKSDADIEKVLAYVNMMRTAIEQICTDVMTLCEKCVGARGLMRPQLFERVIRDLTIYLRQPAPDAALCDAGRFVLENKIPANSIWRNEE